MEQPPCKECHRALRPSKTKLADHPGTIAHWCQGYCRTCYERIRPETERTVRPDNCLVCEKHMRPAHGTAAEFPDTVRHKAYGKCWNCYKKDKRREKVREADDTVQDFIPKHVPGVSAELALLQREREERKRKAALRDARVAQEAARRRFIATRKRSAA